MATQLSEDFKIRNKIEVESQNPAQKACKGEEVSERKETQEKKTDPSSRKRKSAATSNGRVQSYIGRQESDIKSNGVSNSGTPLVKMRNGNSLEKYVVSGTMKKPEKLLSASAPTDDDRKKGDDLDVKEHSKRETDFQLNKWRKREREALERMKNTAQFGADHEAVKELERLLGYELTLRVDSTRLTESISEEEMCVEETERYPDEVQLKEQRKREKEALEKMKNTMQFVTGHEALNEFERLVGSTTTTENSIRLAESAGEDEEEEEEIPASPRALEMLD